MVLTRDEIFEVGKCKTETVQIGKGEAIISEIAGGDYLTLYSDPKNQRPTGTKILIDGKEEDELEVNQGRFQAALIVFGTVDEKGNRIFADDDVDKVERLASGPFLKLAQAAQRVNSSNVNEEIKNSEGDQIELPFSDSASPSDTDIPTT